MFTLRRDSTAAADHVVSFAPDASLLGVGGRRTSSFSGSFVNSEFGVLVGIHLEGVFLTIGCAQHRNKLKLDCTLAHSRINMPGSDNDIMTSEYDRAPWLLASLGALTGARPQCRCPGSQG